MIKKLDRHNNILLSAIIIVLALFFYPIFITDKLSLHQHFALPHSPVLDQLMLFLTFLGDGAFAYTLVGIFMIYQLRLGITALFSVLISGLVAQVLKRAVFYDQYRPSYYFKNSNVLELVEGLHLHSKHSFPSGHATTSFAFFIFLALISKNGYLKTVFFVLAFVVAFTRVYLHQHFYRDIYAGAIIGSLFAILAFLWYQKNSSWMQYSLWLKWKKKVSGESSKN